MNCLNCRQPIKDNLDSCPYCHTVFNAEKIRFIKYIGDEDSLIGYQKSYKLVLLYYIFKYLHSGQELSVDSIMQEIKEFYLNRVHNGLVADYDVDERIQNISDNTTIYEIWAVFKANPYNVINNQGFLFLEKNKRGELIFVVPNDIISNLSNVERENVIELLLKKIRLYYFKHNERLVTEQPILVESSSVKQNPSDTITEPKQQPLNVSRADIGVILIENTQLSVRSKHCLMQKGYTTIGDILNLDEEKLLRIRNLGRKSVDEIRALIEYCSRDIYVDDKIILADGIKRIEDIRLDSSLQDTILSCRAKNALNREGYKLVGDIIDLSEEELLSSRNLGALTVREILAFIRDVRNANGIEQIFDEGSILLKSIKSTVLSVRSKNALTNAGYQVVGDILDLTEPELRNLPSIGANSIEEILQYAITLKQKLADEVSEDEQQKYQVIKYPYNGISLECEEIPVIVLSYFGMRPVLIRKLQNGGIYKLGQLKKMDYSQIQIAMGAEWSKLLHFSLMEFNHGAIVATKTFLDTISKEEDLSFIIERSRGATLQEIGNSHGMTREGIRQSIEKPLKYIKPMAVCLAKALIAKQHARYLTLQDIFDVYDNDAYDSIISYALKESEEIETVDALGLYLIKEKYSYNDILNNAIQEYVGEGVFWRRNINELIEILQDKNISFLELDDVWLYMLSMGYKVYGEYVAPRAVSYGVLLAMIIDEVFPEGISFSDAEAVYELRRQAFARFGDLNLPEDDRPLIARVIDYLVLCDRGKWISTNRVIVDISTLETIKDFIDKSEENIIYYQALFNQFEGLLAMTSDINNYHYLHGVLKLYYNAEYSFCRDYLKKEGTVNGSLSKRIYEYIASKGEAVSRNELKEYLKISSDVMISNVINTNMEIFQWEFNFYNCLKNVNITLAEKECLQEIIAEVFAENQNYCSAKMIYDYCSQLLPNLLERNRVKNATNLFYLTATLIGDKYKFRLPHILPYDSLLSTTEDIARMFVSGAKRLNKNQFNTLADRFGWGQSTASAVFESIVKDSYYRLSRTEYIHRSELDVMETQILEVREYFVTQLTNKPFIGAWEISYSRLPEMKYDWTPQFLETLICHFIKDYRMVAPYYGNNKAERGLYVPRDSKYYAFDEIVVSVMQSNGYVRLTENEMYTLLVISGVIKNSIPDELKESALLLFDNGEYKLREGA